MPHHERELQHLQLRSVRRLIGSSRRGGGPGAARRPPGTAKSELARELTSRIDGARYWEILLSKFTDPKRMFGLVDVAALVQGRYTQVFDGRATQCEIAFLDEIFNCSAGALNETLAFSTSVCTTPRTAGRRLLARASQPSPPATSSRRGEETAAIYDRLLVRLEVGYLADPSNFAALVRARRR
jgi:MoxR-like ATPase